MQKAHATQKGKKPNTRSCSHVNCTVTMGVLSQNDSSQVVVVVLLLCLERPACLLQAGARDAPNKGGQPPPPPPAPVLMTGAQKLLYTPPA